MTLPLKDYMYEHTHTHIHIYKTHIHIYKDLNIGGMGAV